MEGCCHGGLCTPAHICIVFMGALLNSHPSATRQRLFLSSLSSSSSSSSSSSGDSSHTSILTNTMALGSNNKCVMIVSHCHPQNKPIHPSVHRQPPCPLSPLRLAISFNCCEQTNETKLEISFGFQLGVKYLSNSLALEKIMQSSQN